MYISSFARMLMDFHLAFKFQELSATLEYPQNMALKNTLVCATEHTVENNSVVKLQKYT